MSKPEIYDPTLQQPSVTLSASAAKHLQQQIAKAGHGIGVRIATERRGCNGHAYVIDIIDVVEPGDRIFNDPHGLTIAVASSALPLVLGTHIDYVREGLNAKFVYSNPNETGSCGCGESFSVD